MSRYEFVPCETCQENAFWTTHKLIDTNAMTHYFWCERHKPENADPVWNAFVEDILVRYSWAWEQLAKL